MDGGQIITIITLYPFWSKRVHSTRLERPRLGRHCPIHGAAVSSALPFGVRYDPTRRRVPRVQVARKKLVLHLVRLLDPSGGARRPRRPPNVEGPQQRTGLAPVVPREQGRDDHPQPENKDERRRRICAARAGTCGTARTGQHNDERRRRICAARAGASGDCGTARTWSRRASGTCGTSRTWSSGRGAYGGVHAEGGGAH